MEAYCAFKLAKPWGKQTAGMKQTGKHWQMKRIIRTSSLSRIQFGAIAFHSLPPLASAWVSFLVSWGVVADFIRSIPMARFWQCLPFICCRRRDGHRHGFEFGLGLTRVSSVIFLERARGGREFLLFLVSGFLAILLFGWDKVGRDCTFLDVHGLSRGALQCGVSWRIPG